MTLFRIIKEADKRYRLRQKVPSDLMNGKEVWDTVKNIFASSVEAEAFAHEMAMSTESNIVKEFGI